MLLMLASSIALRSAHWKSLNKLAPET